MGDSHSQFGWNAKKPAMARGFQGFNEIMSSRSDELPGAWTFSKRNLNNHFLFIPNHRKVNLLTGSEG